MYLNELKANSGMYPLLFCVSAPKKCFDSKADLLMPGNKELRTETEMGSYLQDALSVLGKCWILLCVRDVTIFTLLHYRLVLG